MLGKERTVSEATTQEHLSVSNSWVMHALLVFMGLCLLTASILAITQPLPYADNPEFIKIMTGYLGFPLAVGVIAYNVWKIVARHDAILIDERGITDHSGALSCGFISWDRIKEVYLLKLHDDDYLCVVPEDQEAWYDGLTKGQKRLAKANMDIGFAPIRIQFKKVSESVSSQDGLAFVRRLQPKKITRVRKPKY